MSHWTFLFSYSDYKPPQKKSIFTPVKEVHPHQVHFEDIESARSPQCVFIPATVRIKDSVQSLCLNLFRSQFMLPPPPPPPPSPPLPPPPCSSASLSKHPTPLSPLPLRSANQIFRSVTFPQLSQWACLPKRWMSDRSVVFVTSIHPSPHTTGGRGKWLDFCTKKGNLQETKEGETELRAGDGGQWISK